MTPELTLAIIKAILEYGPPAIISIAAAMKVKDVTVEDINKLFIDKDPEDYFEH